MHERIAEHERLSVRQRLKRIWARFLPFLKSAWTLKILFFALKAAYRLLEKLDWL